jgi:hypothetical protein
MDALSTTCDGNSDNKLGQLPRVDLDVLRLGIEIDDAAKGRLVQALVKNAITRLIKKQNLYSVAGSVQKHDERPRSRIDPERISSDASEPIERTSEVNGMRRDEDARVGPDHELGSMRAIRSATSSGDQSTNNRNRQPLDVITSILGSSLLALGVPLTSTISILRGTGRVRDRR